MNTSHSSIKIMCSAAIILFAGESMASSIIIGGSNFPLMGYEQPNCRKPINKPLPPFSRTQFSIDLYNQDVRRYNADRSVYISCIKRYVENAQYDIQRIEGAIEDAIEEVRRDY